MVQRHRNCAYNRFGSLVQTRYEHRKKFRARALWQRSHESQKRMPLELLLCHGSDDAVPARGQAKTGGALSSSNYHSKQVRA
jgi:hypothetical protein